MMACENKVVLHDLASSDSRDIPRSCFDSKPPTCLAFLLLNLPSLQYGGGGSVSGGSSAAGSAKDEVPLPSAAAGAAGVAAAARGPRAELLPVLAVGTAGGAIYLLDPQRFTVYAKLQGHKGAVTALLPLAAEAEGGPDLLVSASADGTLAVWDPSRTPARGPDRELPPQRQWKAHDGGGVAAAAFFAVRDPSGQALAPALRLATVGEDKKLAVWGVGGQWAPTGRVQPLAKASCHSVGWAPWGAAGMGAHPSIVLATGGCAALVFARARGGGVMPGASQDTEVLALGCPGLHTCRGGACRPRV